MIYDLFKDISIFSSGSHVCSAKLNLLINFGRRQQEDHFCEIILILDQWFKK